MPFEVAVQRLFQMVVKVWRKAIPGRDSCSTKIISDGSEGDEKWKKNPTLLQYKHIFTW